MTDTDRVITEKFDKWLFEKCPDNGVVVEILKSCGAYLNLQTRSNYAKLNNISYEGAKKFRKNIDLFGCKLIIDND